MPPSALLSAPNCEKLPDEELVALAQQGCRDAFAAIMQRYNQRLFRVARGVVRDDHEAEDVLQESYAKAFEKLSSFRGDAALATWLTAITMNEARGRLRNRKNTVRVEAIETAQQEGGQVIMFPGSDDPEADAARAEARRLLERAVDDLPDTYRVVFIMREIGELSVEETAESLGIRTETVKTRLHRARRLLRQALDEKLASAVKGAFPFLGARCGRISDRVLERLAPKYDWEPQTPA